MPVQTTYLTNSAPAFPGMAFGTGFDSIVAAIQAETSAEIPFGVVVARVASANHLTSPKAKMPVSSGDELWGIVRQSHAYNRETDLGATGLKPGIVMNVQRRGACWVLCEQAVAVTDPVYVRYAAGAGGSQLGAFRNSADTASAVLLKGAVYLAAGTSIGGGQYVVPVEFDFLVNRATA